MGDLLTVLTGDCRDLLKTLAPASIHCVVTSPPFFGLRDYGIPPSVWRGDPACLHQWDEYVIPPRHRPDGVAGSTLQGSKTTQAQTQRSATNGATCVQCGAWLGCLGNEPDPAMYVEHLVEVFRALRPCLREDASVWLNLGDSYGTGTTAARQPSRTSTKISPAQHEAQGRRHGGMAKQLLGIPWMVARALQADGWILRRDVPWVKTNGMPESVEDRPGSAHEYVFLLAKGPCYYYDRHAVMKPYADIKSGRAASFKRENSKRGVAVVPGNPSPTHRPDREDVDVYQNGGRNRRSADWWFESLDLAIDDARAYLAHLEAIRDQGGMLLDQEGEPLAIKCAVQGYSGAHYATFPPKLIEPMILASTSPHACSRCAAPWRRVVETKAMVIRRTDWGEKAGNRTASSGTMLEPARASTVGWEPSCACPHGDDSGRCVVLDPFGGAGTTALVALKHGRAAIIMDLKPDHVEQSLARIDGTQLPLVVG